MKSRVLAGIFALAAGLGLAFVLADGVAARAAPAAGGGPAYNLTGTWEDVSSDGSTETPDFFYYVSSMNESTGAFSGTAVYEPGTSDEEDFTMAGTETGSAATFTLTWTANPGYVSTNNVTFAPLANGHLMWSGSFSDTYGNSGPSYAEQNSTTVPITTTTTASTTTTTTTGTSPSATQVVCNDVSPGSAGDYDQCTATVGGSDAANPSAVPTGTVTFTVNSGGSGGFLYGPTCTLTPSQSGNTAYCSVDYSPPAPAETEPPITATYSGDANFAASSGSPQLGGAPDTDTTTSSTTTPDTSTSTTSTDSATATTDTTATTDDCGGATDVTAALRQPRTCSVAAHQLLALIQDLQALRNAAAGAKDTADYINHIATDIAGGGAAVAAAMTASGNPLAVPVAGGAAMAGGEAVLEDLKSSVAGWGVDQLNSLINTAQAQLDAIIAADKKSHRASPQANLGVVAEPIPIVLELPRGPGAAGLDPLLREDADVVALRTAITTTLARAEAAADDRLLADAAKQWRALGVDDGLLATAYASLAADERTQITSMVTTANHHPATTAEIKLAMRLLAHQPTLIRVDAARLGETSLLRAEEREAAKGPTFSRSAALKDLDALLTSFKTSSTGFVTVLDQVAAEAQQEAAAF